MVVLSEEEIVKLSAYESVFRMALSGYIRGVYQVDVNIMRPVYERLGFRLGSPHCGTCVLQMCRDLAKIYFSQKQDGK